MGMLDVLKRWFGGGRKAEPIRPAPQTRTPAPVSPATATPSQPALLDINDALDAIVKSKSAPAKVDRREKPRVNAREGTRVLVIDDSPTIVALLKRMLEQSGYVALEAIDAESGVAAALSEVPDLIFLDIVLPGMNGFEALRRLRRDPISKTIPIVMISGNELATEQFYAQRIGADDFMKKPFSRSEVFARIEKLLDAEKVPRRHLTVVAAVPTAAVPAVAVVPADAVVAATVDAVAAVPDPVAVAAAAAVPVGPAPVVPAPVAPAPVAAVPVAPARVAAPPVAAVPKAPAPVAPAPLAAVPVAAIPVAAVPVASAPVAPTPPAAVPIAEPVLATVVESPPAAVAPVAAAPVEAASVEAAPVEAAPVEAVLVEAVPVEAVVVATVADDATPSQAPSDEPAVTSESPAIETAQAGISAMADLDEPTSISMDAFDSIASFEPVPTTEAPVIASVQAVITPTAAPIQVTPASSVLPSPELEPEPLQQQAASN